MTHSWEIKMKLPTFDEIEEAISQDTMEGWCTNCGEWTHDSCEPDAEKYECPVCEMKTCYGAEELLVQNLFK